MRARTLFLLASVVGACGGGSDGSTSPPVVDNTPAAIALSPSGSLTIASDATPPTITANVTTKDGRAVANPNIQWSSGDSRIVTVGTAGTAVVLQPGRTGTTSVTATAGVASASISITVTPGAPTALGIRTLPTSFPLGSPPTNPLVVEIQDSHANVVPTSTAPISVSIASGGGTLGGKTTVAATAGVATFTDLSISGAFGARTLSVTSPGFAPLTSAPVTVTAPVLPFIQPDSNAITITIPVGSNAPQQTLRILNGGSTPFTLVSTDPVAYDAGQPTGWLLATVTGGTTRTLTLTPATSQLPLGTYHATVSINAAGALNTPVPISVTLRVVNTFDVTFGTGTSRVRVVDVGATVPALAVALGGVVQPPTGISFASRATSVVTVNAAGQITAVGPGQTWVAASAQGLSDSVFVIVPRNATGPVLRTDLAGFVVHTGDVTTVDFILDPRGTNVAGATVVVGYETENSMFTVVSAIIPTQNPMPVGQNSSVGVFKVTVASATGLPGAVTMLELRLMDRTIGLSGFLTFTILDAVSADGTDVTPLVTSTRYPIIIR